MNESSRPQDGRKPRIIFMGTPEFAVPSLRALVEADLPVIGAITSTDKWGGRGKKKRLQSAVKKYCLENRIPVLQPKSLKRKTFVHKLRSMGADLQVVVAFRMLPEVVWSMPPLGTINLHASLLPKYRGAAPINWAIIRGEKETGLTTFLLRHEIDTGSILFQHRMSIRPDDTAGSLHDRMKDAGASLVVRTVEALAAGTATPQPQPDTGVTKAPKIFREDCRISFKQSVSDIDRFIRGLSPYPGAWTLIDGLEMKIYKAGTVTNNERGLTRDPGSIQTDNKTYLRIAGKDGWIEVHQLQLEGKRRMDIRNFLNGYDLKTRSVSEGRSS